MNSNQVIGANLRKCRQASGVDMAPFAKHLGIDMTALIQIEDGHRALTAYQASIASEYLGIKVSELIGGVGNEV